MTQKKDDENLGSFYAGRMRPPPEPERQLPKGLLTGVTVLAFVGVIWYAYPQGGEKYTDLSVPVITADTTPYKSKPDDPGGMEVRHQDSTVFDTLSEKPVSRPEKIAPQQQAKLPLEAKKMPLNLDQHMKPEPAKVEKKPKESPPVEEKAVETPPAPLPEKAAVTNPPPKSEEVAPEKKKEESIASTPASDGKVYIQLGAYRAISGAKTDWEKLQKKYPQHLKKLSMKTEKVDLGAKGVFYRLQAGAVEEARAKEICAALAKGSFGGCMLVK